MIWIPKGLFLTTNVLGPNQNSVPTTSSKHWFFDSGCSKHMTENKSKFIHLDLKEE